jgi:hypothetical protein
LNHPAAVKPGDTIWLRGGTYDGLWVSRLKGTAAAPIIVRQYPGERAVLRNHTTDTWKSKDTLNTQFGAYTWFWGFEIANANTKRVSSQNGSWPTDGVTYGAGIDAGTAGAGIKFINLLVHDNGCGVSLWNGATDTEVYGCVIYYNGWNAPDRTHGHGLYVQNTAPSVKRITDCLVLFNAQEGCQVYGTDNGVRDNVQITGSVFAQNGQLFGPAVVGRNLLVGGTSVTRDPVLAYSCLYRDAGGPGSDFYWGYTAGTANGVMFDNYIACNTQFGGVHAGLLATGNQIFGSLISPPPGVTAQPPTPKPHSRVFVRPNLYESGRANIVVYNWDKADTVTANIAGIGLAVGDRYELRNALNFYGDVVTGTYNGAPIAISMVGRTPSQPSGIATPRSTFPEFGAFVVQRGGGILPPLPPPPPPPAITNAPPLAITCTTNRVPVGWRDEITCTTNSPPQPPTTNTQSLAITAIPDQPCGVSDHTWAAPFTVTPATATVTGSASNDLVPISGIRFYPGSSPGTRYVVVYPQSARTGTVTITLTARDGLGHAASTTFRVTVR